MGRIWLENMLFGLSFDGKAAAYRMRLDMLLVKFPRARHSDINAALIRLITEPVRGITWSQCLLRMCVHMSDIPVRGRAYFGFMTLVSPSLRRQVALAPSSSRVPVTHPCLGKLESLACLG